MSTQPSFKTPLPILRKIEQCRLKQEKRLDLRGGTAFGQFLLPRVPPEVLTLTHLEELDLSHNAIQVVPEDINQLKHLKRIDLRDNPLRQIADVFGLVLHYADFQKLKLSRENIVGLKLTLFSYDAPAGIFDFPNLVELEMTQHRLKQVPTWVGQLTQIKSLNLSNNRLTSLEGLSPLVNLTSLNLSENELTSVEGLSPLVNLTSLNLSENELTSVEGLSPLVNLTSLNLSENELTSVEGLSPLINLSSLDLSSNQLMSIEGLSPLVNLSSLYLSYNQLTSLEGPLLLVNLSSLYLRRNNLTSLESLSPLVNLSSLDLRGNNLTSLEGLSPLVNLSSLHLSYNQLTSVEGLSLLVNLSSLDLSDNQLTSVEGLSPLVNLASLYLIRNNLTNLKGLSPLVNLSSLDLRGNNLTSVEGLSSLINLSSLYLSDNKLTSVEGLSPLVNLSCLYLSDNKLTSVEGLSPLVNLSSLDLSYNQLTSVEGLSSLVNLSSLDLSYNQLTSVKGLALLINLSSLFLWNNGLASVEGLVPLVNLTFLNLRENQLTNAKGLSPLVNLSSLDLSYNQLTSVEGLSSLVNLSSLDLWRDQLASVEELASLINLSSLSLGGNQLTKLPETLFTLPKLEYLDLDKNPIAESWIEELGLENGKVDLLRIRNYFRQLAKDQDYLYEAKLLIVGEGGAGKTSLARKIQNPGYQLAKNGINSTEGIDVMRWHFPYSAACSYRVNIWDFGGQEIYHATHQFFLTKRALYVLVADNRKEDTDFYYWLSVVELLSDNSPLLIVKNEKDDRTRDINGTALKFQFDNLKDIYATNLLKNNKDFSRLLDDLQHLLKHLPHIGKPLPKRWIDVRTALEQDVRNYISLQDFINLCQQQGFKNQGDILGLSETLHDLGSILHFQKDPLLNKTVFLKPYWATQAVYHVLDNQGVKDNFGQFTKADLAQIWYESEYDFIHDELLQLMLHFKLCYPLTYCPNTYIAPQLLTVVQPQYEWSSANNLVVFYRNYEFMPKGILTQLIIALHQSIADQQHRVWRNGLVLEKNHTQAEIIEDYDKWELQIRVAGQNKRDLMTVIMYELDKIHGSYHKQLEYDVLLPCNCENFREIPEFFKYAELKHFANHHRPIQCRKCFESLDAEKLIEGVLDVTKLEKRNPEEKSSGNVYIINNPSALNIVHNEHGKTDVKNENGHNGGKEPRIRSSWANGLFYLVTITSLVLIYSYIAKNLPFYSLALVVVGGILTMLLVGILQLRHDNSLKEESFVQLIVLVIKQLPLLGKIVEKWKG